MNLRPIFEIMAWALPSDGIERIVDACVHQPATPAIVKRLLNASGLPNDLCADLWDLRFPPPKAEVADMTGVHDRAAIEAFRYVLADYQALNELGPRERTQVIQHFLMDVDMQVRQSISIPFSVFKTKVLDREPFHYEKSHDLFPHILASGRRFIQSGLWPVAASTFRRIK